MQDTYPCMIGCMDTEDYFGIISLFRFRALSLSQLMSVPCVGPPQQQSKSINQVVARLQKEVGDLVLEIFERLPQTVDGFEGGDLIREGMKVSRSGPE